MMENIDASADDFMDVFFDMDFEDFDENKLSFLGTTEVGGEFPSFK